MEVSLGPTIFERPKSTNLTSAWFVLSVIRIFSSLRSLWAIPYMCK